MRRALFGSLIVLALLAVAHRVPSPFARAQRAQLAPPPPLAPAPPGGAGQGAPRPAAKAFPPPVAPKPPAPGVAPRPPAEAPLAVPKPHEEKAEVAGPDGPPWTVEGYGAVLEDAQQAALVKARTQVVTYLARQDPPVEWRPTLDYVDRSLVSKRSKGEDLHDPQLGRLYKVAMEVNVDAKALRDMRGFDHQAAVQERQLLLAKVLGGLVALLAAVAVYFRLDEATKGYYTGWLRLGAVALVAVVGATLWLIS